MSFLFDIIKGILIGVANIIPGVSGGTMMVSMGVYEKIIGVVNNLFKDIKKSIITLLPLGIGMVLAVFFLVCPNEGVPQSRENYRLKVLHLRNRSRYLCCLFS